jgi:hypothetical protein
MSASALGEFYIDVKKLEGDVWVAKITDGLDAETTFTDTTEENVREKVRAHLLEIVAKSTNKPVDTLQARLKRTWRVRIVELATSDGEDDLPLFDLFA